MKTLTIDGKTYTVYTTKETAEMTNIAISSIKRRCKSGNIPSFFINGQYLITQQTIDKGITKLPGGRKKKCPDPHQSVTSITTSESSTTDTPSTQKEKGNTMSLLEHLTRLSRLLFTRDTNSPQSSQ